MRGTTEKKSPETLSDGGWLVGRLRACAASITGGPGAVATRDLLREAADELEGVRVRGAGVATPGDHARALAFIASHELRVRQYVYDDGVTLRPTDEQQADAVQALAQAFADEREPAEMRAAWLQERLEESNARLRETIGICLDIGKLMPQISGALDAYAKPPPQVLACGELDGLSRACELGRGHRGPCGAAQ